MNNVGRAILCPACGSVLYRRDDKFRCFNCNNTFLASLVWKRIKSYNPPRRQPRL
jgi:uncharacterized Zn finger protein (UPF0148 family)